MKITYRFYKRLPKTFENKHLNRLSHRGGAFGYWASYKDRDLWCCIASVKKGFRSYPIGVSIVNRKGECFPWLRTFNSPFIGVFVDHEYRNKDIGSELWGKMVSFMFENCEKAKESGLICSSEAIYVVMKNKDKIGFKYEDEFMSYIKMSQVNN